MLGSAHKVFAGPIDDVTFDDVRAFCVEQVRENTRLEYKQEFSSRRPGHQIAKLVAALANTQGGVVLYGVDEVEDRLPNLAPTGQPLGDDARRRVLSASAANVAPPVLAEVSGLLQNPEDSGKGFLLIRVAASDEVPHTVAGNTDVYVRISDQSEPVRASVEQIALMLARRDRAISLQEARRQEARRRLVELIGPTRRKRTRAAIWVSVGPRTATEPFFVPADLRDQLPKFSLFSRCWARHQPVDSPSNIKTVLDGVYAIDEHRQTAAYFDIFGNITLFAEPGTSNWLVDPGKPCLDGGHLDLITDGRVDALYASYLGDRMLVGLHAAQQMYACCGFVGVLIAKLEVYKIRGLPLVGHLSRSAAVTVLGTCPLDDNLSTEETITTADLGDDGSDVAVRLLKRLLWSWGCPDPKVPALVLKSSKKALYGR